MAASAGLAPKQQRSELTRERLLDAAVQELLAHGYTGLTTAGVSRRAGVSRGAHQHHFPFKEELLAEAVVRLAERQLEGLRERMSAVPTGRARVERGLDITFELYSGPLFAATLELSLASREHPQLREVIAFAERTVRREIQMIGRDVFEADGPQAADVDRRWAMAISTARGIAVLGMLGHPRAAVARQWRFARGQLAALLAPSSQDPQRAGRQE
ncbi:MAG TPA: helix-turn-helix domain-containing protein [Solirubrobacteraceae bacterium]|nr:helix-turn-helix domain-containing protein [Solirubrobacteraceae bacterium]